METKKKSNNVPLQAKEGDLAIFLAFRSSWRWCMKEKKKIKKFKKTIPRLGPQKNKNILYAGTRAWNYKQRLRRSFFRAFVYSNAPIFRFRIGLPATRKMLLNPLVNFGFPPQTLSVFFLLGNPFGFINEPFESNSDGRTFLIPDF